MGQFGNVGLIGRMGSGVGSGPVVESLSRLVAILCDRGCQVVIEEETSTMWPDHGLAIANKDTIGERCDLVIVVGGDGSLLGAARALARHGVPVLGVNRGKLGFLTDILPAELEAKVDEVLSGQFIEETRFLLDVSVVRNGSPVGEGEGLNDIVLHPGKSTRMIEFELFIEGQFVYSQKSDGLIVSTPTGSTAYSLSAGGPIMQPKLDALVLVPMFPHTLSSRPIVIDGSSEIKIQISAGNNIYPQISCDGQNHIGAAPGDTVYIHKKPHEFRLIHPVNHNFYSICRDKLGWGNRLDE